MLTHVKKAIFLDTLHENAPVVFVPLLKTSGLLTEQKSPISIPGKNEPLKKAMPIKKNISSSAKLIKPLDKKAVVKKEPVVKKTTMPIEKKKEIKTPEIKKKEPDIKKAAVAVPETKKANTIPVTAENKVPDKKQTLQLVGRDDLEIMALSNQVKETILSQWKRPTNIPLESVCQVRVIIDKNGSKEIIIEKSSQALMLDIAVRNFLTHYEFPNQAWDKEFVINF